MESAQAADEEFRMIKGLGEEVETAEGDSGSRSPSGESAPADELGFPQVSLLEHRLASVDVAEVFPPPRVTLEAKQFGLKKGEAWDLTTGWNFNRKDHQEMAEKYIE